MSLTVNNKNLGHATAYAYAVAGGYTGTEEEFTELLGNIATDLSEIENLSVTVTTLPAGSSATASYADGVLSLGIPKGDKGDTGITPQLSIGTVSTLPAGSSATASIGGTAENPTLNLGLPEGHSGDANNISADFSTSKTYAVGEYVIYSGDSYRFTAVHAAGAWVGTDAVQVPLGNDVSALKSAFDALDASIYDTTTIDYIRCDQIPGATMRKGSSNKFTSYISIDSLTTYDSYYKVVEEDTQIWFEDTTSAYVSLCVGDSYTSQETIQGGALRLYCSNSVRYRKSDNNLPTRQSPVTVPAGGVFVVTVTTGGTDLVYGVNTETTKTVKSDFAEEIITQIPEDGVRVEIQTNSVILHGKKYNVTFTKKTTTQGYQWNITSLSGKGDNVLPSSTDIIGVLQYDGENNFMGGVHGNESNIEFSLWAEGHQITADGIYKNVRVWMNSHLYSVNDPTVNAVDRFVEMAFDENGWKCRNTFKVIVAGTVKVSYASGLFGFNRADVNLAVCNLGPVDLTSEVRQYYNYKFKQLIVNFANNLTVTMESNTAELGFVTYRSSTESYKAYFADVNNQAVSVGNYITGECKYTF